MEPQYKQIKDIISGKIKSTNINMPVVYNVSDESMRFDSKCTAEDAVIAIL